MKDSLLKKMLQWIFFIPLQISILILIDIGLFFFFLYLTTFEITFFKFWLFFSFGGFGLFVLIGYGIPALLSILILYTSPLEKVGSISFIFLSGVNQLYFIAMVMTLMENNPFKEYWISYSVTILINLAILIQMLIFTYDFAKQSNIKE